MFWLLLVGVVVLCGLVFCRRRPVPSKLPRVVFVSGCDSGIGLEAALHLASRGCEVVAGCLRPQDADPALVSAVALVLPLDVTSDDSVLVVASALEEKLRDEGKELWCLVNNAGVCVFGEFAWQTWDQVVGQVEVNLLGTMRLTRALLPLLRAARGRIVTVTSVNGSVAYPGLSVYSATKFALEGFCNALRIELRPLGVTVIVLAPGDLARATRIMAGHKAQAQAMWTSMGFESRVKDGSRFYRFHRAALSSFGLSSPNRLEDSPLLRDLQAAVIGQAPFSRRVSAPYHHRLCYALLIALPHTVCDAIISAAAAIVLRSVPDDGKPDPYCLSLNFSRSELDTCNEQTTGQDP